MSLIFKNRSTQKEILDDFELKGNDLSQNLKELQLVNSKLGGYTLVKEGIEQIVQKGNLPNPIKVADIGCGGGDTLRELAGWSKTRPFRLELMGLDANSNAIAFANERSADFPEIEYHQVNIFSEEFRQMKCDITLFNLFVHHFEEKQIIDFLAICKSKNSVVLINDLQRSAVAYTLFNIGSKLFRFSKISRHDGLLSIQKAFTRKDLRELLRAAGFSEFSIKWKWAFRYQVIAWR